MPLQLRLACSVTERAPVVSTQVGALERRLAIAHALRSSSCRMLLVATLFPWPPKVARGLSLEVVRLQHVRGRGSAAERSEEQSDGAGEATEASEHHGSSG